MRENGETHRSVALLLLLRPAAALPRLPRRAIALTQQQEGSLAGLLQCLTESGRNGKPAFKRSGSSR